MVTIVDIFYKWQDYFANGGMHLTDSVFAKTYKFDKADAVTSASRF